MYHQLLAMSGNFRFLFLCFALLGGGFPLVAVAQTVRPTDPSAYRKAKNLYTNLHGLSGQRVLFGHQDAFAYGIGWKGKPGASDVQSVCGSHPMVIGWDLGKLGQSPVNIDSVDFALMRGRMLDAYALGAINTASWHWDNPVTGGSSWDQTPAVYAIIPGGEKHEAYKTQLRALADFFTSLKPGPFANPIPIVFRPFHEHTGSWFWWGRGNCTAEEYKTLWRFTVHYLRDSLGVHNLLYAYSTDVFRSEADYLEFYPGDEYVDILGTDNYRDVSERGAVDSLTWQLAMLGKMARERGKLSAFTETGLEAIPHPSWWTDVLLSSFTSHPEAQAISWVMVWRNANTKHHYAPYPGHPSSENFLSFTQHPTVMLLDPKARSLYRKHPALNRQVTAGQAITDTGTAPASTRNY